MNFWVGITVLVTFVVIMALIPFYDSIMNNFYVQCITKGGIPSPSGGGHSCSYLFGSLAPSTAEDLDDRTMEFPKEHYDIAITGLQDTYLVGDPYSFSYVLSGFGNPCGSKTITFPINKTHDGTIVSSGSCSSVPPRDFVLDIKETYGTTYGHIPLQEAGIHTVRIQFEKGSSGPTIEEKTFTVSNP